MTSCLDAPNQAPTARGSRPAVVAGLTATLWAWLDAGLREGKKGQLQAEVGPALALPGSGHVLVCEGVRPVAHAAYRLCRVWSDGLLRVLGLIGLVYTDPRDRMRGHASRVVEAAVQALEGAGAEGALLWSDRRSFYARLGFLPVGREVFWAFDAGVRARLLAALDPAIGVGPVEAGEWGELERLYAGKSHRVERPAGLLEGLAQAPDCRVRVARRDGRVLAYAALGRGDDLRGVVHEWAGDGEGLRACLVDLAATGPVLALSGPDPSPVASLLREAGAGSAADVFALARPLAAAERRAPDPYLWGFDSI